MKHYYDLESFLDKARGIGDISNGVLSFSSGSKTAGVDSQASLVEEGVSAQLPGTHIYFKIDLTPGLATSNIQEERLLVVKCYAEAAQIVQQQIRASAGVITEVQGPVVHAFIPQDQQQEEEINQISSVTLGLIQKRVGGIAREKYLRATASYSHGDTVLVGSVSINQDQSIVSLANAANIAAKVMWKHSDDWTDGAIVGVSQDGSSAHVSNHKKHASKSLDNELSVNFSDTEVLSSDDFLIRNRSSAHVTAGASVEEPDRFFGVAMRIDLDGFSRAVMEAFALGGEQPRIVANRFYDIMKSAKEFLASRGEEIVQLPWSGDSCNFIVSSLVTSEYQVHRRELILKLPTDFVDFMKQRHPEAEWSVSVAAGDVENAQAGNTLSSRLFFSGTVFRFACGCPPERSLRGQASEKTEGDRGILWKEDVKALDAKFDEIFVESKGGENYRHYSNADVRERILFGKPKPAYQPRSKETAKILATPQVRPFSIRE